MTECENMQFHLSSNVTESSEESSLMQQNQESSCSLANSSTSSTKSSSCCTSPCSSTSVLACYPGPEPVQKKRKHDINNIIEYDHDGTIYEEGHDLRNKNVENHDPYEDSSQFSCHISDNDVIDSFMSDLDDDDEDNEDHTTAKKSQFCITNRALFAHSSEASKSLLKISSSGRCSPKLFEAKPIKEIDFPPVAKLYDKYRPRSAAVSPCSESVFSKCTKGNQRSDDCNNEVLTCTLEPRNVLCNKNLRRIQKSTLTRNGFVTDCTAIKQKNIPYDIDNRTTSIADNLPNKKKRTESIQPGHGGIIYDTNDNDVLKGRGSQINRYVGNVRYRDLIHRFKATYVTSSKRSEKIDIAEKIVNIIRESEPPGRFLEEVITKDNGEKLTDGKVGWVEIGDKKATNKVRQALRENAKTVRMEFEENSSKRKRNKSDLDVVLMNFLHEMKRVLAPPIASYSAICDTTLPSISKQQLLDFSRNNASTRTNMTNVSHQEEKKELKPCMQDLSLNSKEIEDLWMQDEEFNKKIGNEDEGIESDFPSQMLTLIQFPPIELTPGHVNI